MVKRIENCINELINQITINKKLLTCVESIVKIINYRIFVRDLESIANKKIKNIVKIK